MSNNNSFSDGLPLDRRASLQIHPAEGTVLILSGYFESQISAAYRRSRLGKLDIFGLDLAFSEIEVSILHIKVCLATTMVLIRNSTGIWHLFAPCVAILISGNGFVMAKISRNVFQESGI